MQKSNTLRIIIDTNLWISFLISKKHYQLDALLMNGKIKILFSAELLDEIKLTINKPKLKKHFGPNALEDMLSNVEAYIEFTTITSTVAVCRDVKDNFLLALAKDGKAGFLITGDNDLLELQKFGKTKILNFSGFLETQKV